MGYIREFDGLRGVLALYVFLAHAIELGPYGWVEAHMRAFLAVDIFIILSGFVIFHLLSQGEDYGTFITRRFLRLYPVFAVCFLLALVLRASIPELHPITMAIPAATKDLTGYLASHAALVHGAIPEQWLPISATAVLPPAWSVSVEWQFYLVAPFFFALLLRPRLALVLGILALCVIRLLVERHQLGVLFPGGPRDLTFQMNAFLPLKIELFALGGLSWLAWRELAKRQPTLPAAFGWVPWIVFPLVWCGTGHFAMAAWAAICAALIDARFGTGAVWSKLARATLDSRPLQFLGAISYPLYLVHLPVSAVMAYGVGKLGIPLSAPVLAVAVVATGAGASVAAAWLLHVALEKPVIRWGKRLTARWQPAPETPPLGQQLTRS